MSVFINNNMKVTHNTQRSLTTPLDGLFSVEIHQSFQILYFYNGGTHQNFQKCVLDLSKSIAISMPVHMYRDSVNEHTEYM